MITEFIETPNSALNRKVVAEEDHKLNFIYDEIELDLDQKKHVNL